MRVLALAGEPASGKTTLMRLVMHRLGLAPAAPVKVGLLVYHAFESERLAVLGDYSDPQALFAGTDRLSMAVAPQAQQILASLARGPWADWTVLYEGDRLTGQAFLDALAGFAEVRVLVVEAPEATLAARHGARGDSQTATFLAGRRTKVRRLLERGAFVVPNGTEEEGAGAAARVVDMIRTAAW